jgi:hypothetical protein
VFEGMEQSELADGAQQRGDTEPKPCPKQRVGKGLLTERLTSKSENPALDGLDAQTASTANSRGALGGEAAEELEPVVAMSAVATSEGR